jgi:hypothetical protein
MINKSIDEMLSIARDEKSTKEMLSDLVNSDYYPIRMEVASNKNTSKECLLILANDSNYLVKLQVAKNNKATTEALDILSKSAESRIRIEIAKRKDCPAKILKNLSTDKDSYVVSAVASNIKTNKKILDVLSESNYIDVVEGVAGNISTDEEVLIRLLNHKDYLFRKVITKSIAGNAGSTPKVFQTLLDMYPNYSFEGVARLARNPNCPKHLLERLYDVEYLRDIVLKNPSCPAVLKVFS